MFKLTKDDIVFVRTEDQQDSAAGCMIFVFALLSIILYVLNSELFSEGN